MSYCRFSRGHSDIYVFPHIGGFFQCCGCPSGGFFSTTNAAVMIRHMKAHRDEGLKVPDYAFMGVFRDRHMAHEPTDYRYGKGQSA